MILPSNLRVLIATKPVDFRKGMDGLAALVAAELKLEPFSGIVYVFRSKRRRFTSFNIPIAVCGDRVSLASAAWEAIASHQAIRTTRFGDH